MDAIYIQCRRAQDKLELNFEEPQDGMHQMGTRDLRHDAIHGIKIAALLRGKASLDVVYFPSNSTSCDFIFLLLLKFGGSPYSFPYPTCTQ